MLKDACILTTKDFTILEVMRDRCLGRNDRLAPILVRKLEAATVMFREDVPEDVATLSSRVTYRVDGQQPDTRVLSHDHMVSPVGVFLPITTLRGLALLGLAEGQEFVAPTEDGGNVRILLEKVNYQPEAARRGKEALGRPAAPVQRKPALRLIRGARYEGHQSRPGETAGPDDPGPSAA